MQCCLLNLHIYAIEQLDSAQWGYILHTSIIKKTVIDSNIIDTITLSLIYYMIPFQRKRYTNENNKIGENGRISFTLSFNSAYPTHIVVASWTNKVPVGGFFFYDQLEADLYFLKIVRWLTIQLPAKCNKFLAYK